MNERIKDLYKQSANQDYFPIDSEEVYMSAKDLKKFAELIVRECGHCMVDIMLHGGIEPEEGYDIMLKHFGVK
jgi:hypothetical protein